MQQYQQQQQQQNYQYQYQNENQSQYSQPQQQVYNQRPPESIAPPPQDFSRIFSTNKYDL